MRTGILTVLVITAGILAGCNAPRPEALPAGLDDVNLILDDSNLSAQEKRSALADLGLTPVVINALLRSERTANQFGGDLRSAYDKVVAGTLNQLTPDEVQIYADEAKSVDSATTDFVPTDQQAQETVDFFRTHDITTSAELVAVLDNPAVAASLPADLTAANLTGLFVDFDPALLLPNLP
jgi:hypothetical protein